MPIRINLLAEAQALEDMRRRDPVKRAVLAAVLLVVVALVYCATLWAQTAAAKSQQRALEAEWKSIENKYKELTDSEKTAAQLSMKIAALNRYSTNRFFWGSTLNAFQQSFPPGISDKIQVVHIGSSYSYQVTDAVPPKKSGNKTIPGQPATSREKITIIIDGKDYGIPAEQNYNQFKAAIAKQSYFKNLLPSDSILLRQITQPTTEADGRQAASFSLECQFPPVFRSE